MAPSDATKKNRNIDAQLHSILYTTAEKYFRKFTFCRTFGAHKLVNSEPFLDYLYEFWHLLSALGSDVRKIVLYRYTSTYPPKLLPWNFRQISRLSIRSGAQVRTNFPPIFRLFAIFDRNFAKIVAPPSDENENYVERLKEQSLVKKSAENASKSGNKRQRNACSNYAPLERTGLRTRSVTKNKQTKNKHHIFAPTDGARCSIYPKLCMVVELVVPIHFSI